MDVLVKAGYRIIIKLYENDHDIVGVSIRDGLNIDEINFIVDLLRFFKNNDYMDTTYSDFKYNKILSAFKMFLYSYDIKKFTTLKSFANIDRDIKELDQSKTKIIFNNLLVEFGLNSNYCFIIREYEYFNIQYTPVDLIIHNVNDQFRMKDITTC